MIRLGGEDFTAYVSQLEVTDDIDDTEPGAIGWTAAMDGLREGTVSVVFRTDDFVSVGPFSTSSPDLFGVPVVESEHAPPGQVLLINQRALRLDSVSFVLDPPWGPAGDILDRIDRTLTYWSEGLGCEVTVPYDSHPEAPAAPTLQESLMAAGEAVFQFRATIVRGLWRPLVDDIVRFTSLPAVRAATRQFRRAERRDPGRLRRRRMHTAYPAKWRKRR